MRHKAYGHVVSIDF